MDLRLLEYFLAVARTGNITRAAEQLHVTQPTVSRQLAELEEMLGSPLLIRGKRQVTLTEAGVLFQQRAEEIITLLDKTRRDLADQRDLVGGTVALGCVESCASRLLPDRLGAFSRLYPQVRYEIYSADGDDIREKLDRGELDFGVLLEPVEAPSTTASASPTGKPGGFSSGGTTRWPAMRPSAGRTSCPFP